MVHIHKDIKFKTIFHSPTQMCFSLKAKCCPPNIDCLQAKNVLCIHYFATVYF